MFRWRRRYLTLLAIPLAAFAIGASALAGPPGGMVTICKVPSDNPGNAREITVAAPAVEAHLASGSTYGYCP